tara:strand:+ start:35511 stop:36062 length:552 start_codon:yes stop_codon:yes gene_type:complete
MNQEECDKWNTWWTAVVASWDHKEPKETLMEVGKRNDSGKLKWHLIPIPAMLAFCKVWHGGAVKYAEEQWRGGLKYTRIYRPMMSHLNKWLTAGSYDKELGTHHLMMVAWGCFVLYMYEVVLKIPDLDDRPDKETLTDDDFEYYPMPFQEQNIQMRNPNLPPIGCHPDTMDMGTIKDYKKGDW